MGVLAAACTRTNKTDTVAVIEADFSVMELESTNASITKNGKEWLRCAMGQVWANHTCTGQAQQYTFSDAQKAAQIFNLKGYNGKKDWRVPTIRELQALRVCSTDFVDEQHVRDLDDGDDTVPRRCNEGANSPTINPRAFPQTPFAEAYFWSSSAYEGNSSKAWGVFFDDGYVYFNGNQDDKNYVRLVRSN